MQQKRFLGVSGNVDINEYGDRVAAFNLRSLDVNRVFSIFGTIVPYTYIEENATIEMNDFVVKALLSRLYYMNGLMQAMDVTVDDNMWLVRGGADNIPESVPRCGFTGTDCDESDDLSAAIIALIVVSVVITFFALCFIMLR